MISPAHVDHFTNALHKYWLSDSKDVTNAVSSANCIQCFRASVNITHAVNFVLFYGINKCIDDQIEQKKW